VPVRVVTPRVMGVVWAQRSAVAERQKRIAAISGAVRIMLIFSSRATSR
jgi:hypothetical protein